MTRIGGQERSSSTSGARRGSSDGSAVSREPCRRSLTTAAQLTGLTSPRCKCLPVMLAKQPRCARYEAAVTTTGTILRTTSVRVLASAPQGAAGGRAEEYSMKRKRPVRPKKPYIATPDQVRITRDAHSANIDYAEANVSGVHLVLSREELASMTDEDILEVHNRCIEAQQASADSFDWVAVEVPPG